MKTILLNPGPTNTLDEVKNVHNAYTDFCHRTEEFEKIYQSLKTRILDFFAGQFSDEWEIAILGGSGTSALESMIVSLVPDKTHLIIAGKYGHRAAQIFKSYNIAFTQEVCSNSLEVKSSKIENLYFVENETTTGEKFSLAEMVDKFPKAKFFIDATSSFGASDYLPHLNQIAAISFCSNKCLQSPAGLAFVLYRKTSVVQSRPSYTLNVTTYQNEMPFTIPPQLVAAAEKSLSLYKNQETKFNQRRNRIVSDLQDLGIRCINKNPSNSVIGFQHPTLDYEEIKESLSNHNIIIYSGIPDIPRSFRVSTMSVLFDSQYKKILEAFRETCVC
jgi:2-aminoethylphosphonate-pyruvate transaminase